MFSKVMLGFVVFSFTYLIIIRIDKILVFWGIWMTFSCKNFFLFILYPEFQASCRWWFNERKQGVSVREGRFSILTSGSFLCLQQRGYRTSFHTGGLLNFTEFKRFYCAIYRHIFSGVAVFYYFSGWSYDFVLFAVKQSYPRMK